MPNKTKSDMKLCTRREKAVSEHRAHPMPPRRMARMLTAVGMGCRDIPVLSAATTHLAAQAQPKEGDLAPPCANTTQGTQRHPCNGLTSVLAGTPQGLCPPQNQSHALQLAVLLEDNARHTTGATAWSTCFPGEAEEHGSPPEPPGKPPPQSILMGCGTGESPA